MGSFAILTIIASILVLSHSMPYRDIDALLERLQQNEAREAAYEELGQHVRNLDALGGGNLIRDTRGMDSLAGITFGGNKRFDSLSGITFGGLKRRLADLPMSYYAKPSMKRGNFDEIDHSSGFVGFAKRNFDEIDHSNFDSFVKREATPEAKPAKAPVMQFRY